MLPSNGSASLQARIPIPDAQWRHLRQPCHTKSRGAGENQYAELYSSGREEPANKVAVALGNIAYKNPGGDTQISDQQSCAKLEKTKTSVSDTGTRLPRKCRNQDQHNSEKTYEDMGEIPSIKAGRVKYRIISKRKHADQNQLAANKSIPVVAPV